MVITSEIGCRTGTVRGQAKKNNVSIPWKTGKSTIVTHGMIRVNSNFNVEDVRDDKTGLNSVKSKSELREWLAK